MRARAAVRKISPGEVVPVEDYLSCVEEAWKIAEYDEKQDVQQLKHETNQVPGQNQSVNQYLQDKNP